MKVDIWSRCQGENYVKSLNVTAWRIVEAQHITATRKLVDSLEEQVILEDLIESSKPPMAAQYLDLHPLLSTSFRYPPLKHGSRFGTHLEYSLWYGSLELKTAMAEKAFYQFNFLRGSKATFGLVEIPLTAFSVKIKTSRGVNLAEKPFDQYTQVVSSPNSYAASQALGVAMRKANVEAFCYLSARDATKKENIGLFTPRAFARKEPNSESFQSWQCIASDNVIEFIRSSTMVIENYSFPMNEFLIDGALPFPAN